MCIKVTCWFWGQGAEHFTAAPSLVSCHLSQSSSTLHEAAYVTPEQRKLKHCLTQLTHLISYEFFGSTGEQGDKKTTTVQFILIQHISNLPTHPLSSFQNCNTQTTPISALLSEQQTRPLKTVIPLPQQWKCNAGTLWGE